MQSQNHYDGFSRDENMIGLNKCKRASWELMLKRVEMGCRLHRLGPRLSTVYMRDGVDESYWAISCKRKR